MAREFVRCRYELAGHDIQFFEYRPWCTRRIFRSVKVRGGSNNLGAAALSACAMCNTVSIHGLPCADPTCTSLWRDRLAFAQSSSNGIPRELLLVHVVCSNSRMRCMVYSPLSCLSIADGSAPKALATLAATSIVAQ
jgi:hypothetical protein